MNIENAEPNQANPSPANRNNFGQAAQATGLLDQIKPPPTAQSMRYGDLVYLHAEGIDGYVQSSG